MYGTFVTNAAEKSGGLVGVLVSMRCAQCRTQHVSLDWSYCAEVLIYILRLLSAFVVGWLYGSM